MFKGYVRSRGVVLGTGPLNALKSKVGRICGEEVISFTPCTDSNVKAGGVLANMFTGQVVKILEVGNNTVAVETEDKKLKRLIFLETINQYEVPIFG